MTNVCRKSFDFDWLLEKFCNESIVSGSVRTCTWLERWGSALEPVRRLASCRLGVRPRRRIVAAASPSAIGWLGAGLGRAETGSPIELAAGRGESVNHLCLTRRT